MSELELPAALRFNTWREWRALAMSLPSEQFHSVEHRCRNIRSIDVAAVVQYVSLTGYRGIEFVVVTSYVDAAPFRRFGDELILVPCANVLAAAADVVGPPTRDLLYDGWLQLFDSSEEAIVSGLRRIDEVVAMIAHAHGCQCRWVVKYSETRSPQLRRTRHLGEVDQAHLALETQKLHLLPSAPRAAVVRAMTWVAESRRRVRQSDRFLALWLAMESLGLSLYENASAMDLSMEPITPTRNGKRAPSIRQRTERTLAAIFGPEDPAVTWPNAKIDGNLSPAEVRAAMVHEGLSGVDAATQVDLDALGNTLEGIVEASIARALGRNGEAPIQNDHQGRSAFQFRFDGVSNSRGFRLVDSESEITPGLLWRKGHL